jgi:hypothetical protein
MATGTHKSESGLDLSARPDLSEKLLRSEVGFDKRKAQPLN